MIDLDHLKNSQESHKVVDKKNLLRGFVAMEKITGFAEENHVEPPKNKTQEAPTEMTNPTQVTGAKKPKPVLNRSNTAMMNGEKKQNSSDIDIQRIKEEEKNLGIQVQILDVIVKYGSKRYDHDWKLERTCMKFDFQ